MIVPNIDTPLKLAVRGSNLDKVHILLGAGAPVDALSRSWPLQSARTTAFQIASYLGLKDIATTLHRAGAEVDALDSLGNTALFAMARLGDEDAAIDRVQFLVDLGANVNAVNSFGEPVVVHAANTRNWGVVEILLKSGWRLEFD